MTQLEQNILNIFTRNSGNRLSPEMIGGMHSMICKEVREYLSAQEAESKADK